LNNVNAARGRVLVQQSTADVERGTRNGKALNQLINHVIETDEII